MGYSPWRYKESAMTEASEHAPMQNMSTDCGLQNPSMDFDTWIGEVQHGDSLTSRLRLGELLSLFFFFLKAEWHLYTCQTSDF